MLVYLIGASILIKGKITYGDILAFLTYLVYVTNPVTSFSNLKFIFASMNPSAKRLYELLHIPEEQDSQKLILDTENYILEFQNVNYTIEDRTILKDISFTLNSGDRVAIVGDNGSGKSTLVNLIARFIEPSSGMILLNGENIRELNIEQYREHICIADTKSHLFELPIIENIDICAENGSASIVDLDAAITLSEFDDNLIQAIKKNEGRNSNNLSAGEKQKIVIARSLWNKRAIMIFDEATCNIDLKSRKKIESVIAYQFCQSITIFIAHNADSLVHFNKIIFIKDNMIYRIGTYEEMIQDRYFQELFSKNEDNR